MMASMITSLDATAAARSSSRFPVVSSVSKRGAKNAAGFALRAASKPASAILLRARLSSAGKMVAALPVTAAAAALDAMDAKRRVQIFSQLDRALAAVIADAMSADERADLFRALPDEVGLDLLARMPKAASLDVRELIRY